MTTHTRKRSITDRPGPPLGGVGSDVDPWVEAERVLAREPRNVEALRAAGDALADAGRMTEALVRYQTLLTVDASLSTADRTMRRIDRLVGEAGDAFEWPAGYTTARVAVIGNVTINFLLQALRGACLTQSCYARAWSGGFDLYRQEILDASSELYASDPQAVIVVLDWREVVPLAYRANLASDPGEVRAEIDARVGELAELLMTLRSRSKATVLVTGPVPPSQTPLGFLDAGHARGLDGHFTYLRSRLVEQLTPIGGVFVQQTERVLSEVGLRQALSAKMRYLARMPYAEPGLRAMASDMAGFVRQARGKARKCLVLDLDNTLWGGIIGEDGLSGIKLGPDGIGRAYIEFQQEVLRLHQQGVILAICSKNNESDAFEVFEKHPNMVLKPEHFAALRINWIDKPANLRELADEINIGIDSLVFLDDKPVERDAVRQLVPEVLVPDLPKDAAEYPDFVRSLTCFQTLQLTDEDLQRGRFYADERRRETLRKQSGGIDDYLKALGMVVHIRPVDEFTLPRVTQLINRTNQFNLTTRRYTEIEVRQMRDSGQQHVFSLGLEDRYGDNGIVGVAIVKVQHGAHTALIDSLLMSCRILGRNVERVFLAYICDFAAKHGAAAIEGQFVPTEKNGQVADFYPRFGFEPLPAVDGVQRWSFPCGQRRIDRPEYIEVRE